ncbi:MAG TPA: SRPBCC family protein [Chthoniobacteraceae bacterium]|nr:cyclase/dehydrase [Chthoniobacter sp.]HEV7867423.1 SRPBCC family protein [Chthoniobacteraceae bacterium]
MKTVQHTIHVEGPVATVFAAWSDFERFPRFMQEVREVEPLDEKHQRWTANIEGSLVQWETEVTVTIPNQRIAWRILGEDSSSGAVTMQQTGSGTELTLRFAYGATAPWAAMADEEIHASTARDLESFKNYFEGELQRPAT